MGLGDATIETGNEGPNESRNPEHLVFPPHSPFLPGPNRVLLIKCTRKLLIVKQGKQKGQTRMLEKEKEEFSPEIATLLSNSFAVYHSRFLIKCLDQDEYPR